MNHHEAGHGGYIGTRREFLSKCGMGMGALAMGGLPGQLAAAGSARREGGSGDPGIGPLFIWCILGGMAHIMY